ncbi:MAG: ComF family protein [candidate division WOR-3 bacterium]|nr:MAG: ComF family protein [candidate division WOR-3 bacterium]
MHWWKRTRRGHNQSDILSRLISRETGIRLEYILRRIKNTRTQTRLNAEQRRENVRNAFALGNGCVQSKKILLIDDVLTTGATMNECARLLKEHGAAAVYSCVAAITPDKR